MRKGLRKITQSLALMAGLLRVQPQMIGVSQHVFEQQPRLIEHCRIGLARSRLGFHQPERAHVKRTLLAWQSIDALPRWITVNQTITYQATAFGTLENCAKRS